MSEETREVVLQLLRWVHFIFGIIWIGLLYFFNFVNVPFAKTMDGETKKKVVPQLLPRALYWFRWGAMFTFLAGLAYLWLGWNLYYVDKAGHLLTRGKWIMFGAGLGTIMWFNVWFIIWPAQKKIIGWIRDGQASPEMAGLAKKALMASRTNTYLSIPMLFGMGGAAHFSKFDPMWAAGILAAGFAIAWMLINCSNSVASDPNKL